MLKNIYLLKVSGGELSYGYPVEGSDWERNPRCFETRNGAIRGAMETATEFQLEGFTPETMDGETARSTLERTGVLHLSKVDDYGDVTYVTVEIQETPLE